MPLFGRTDRGRDGRVPRVLVDNETKAYRYANWDASALLADLQSALIEASTEGCHLWDSNERLQMYSVATWLASSRQIIGSTLLSSAEQTCGDRLPVDVIEAARPNYAEALRWLQHREEVNLDLNYEFGGDLSVGLTWPQPGLQGTSTELLVALKSVVEYLIYVQYPHVQAVIDGLYLKAEFRRYKDRMVGEVQKLQSALDYVMRVWSDDLDPNQDPGLDLYHRLMALVEDVLLTGVRGLMPVTSDRSLKLLKRERVDPDALPKFDPRQLNSGTSQPRAGSSTPVDTVPKVLDPPTLPQLNPADLRRHRSVKLPEPSAPVAPVLPSFDPGALRRSAGVKREAADVSGGPDLPLFDPGALRRRLRPESQEHHSQEAPGLPPFDPSQLKHKRTN